MPDATDMELVREFARDQSESAFAELVRRHLNLVYSVALRHTGLDGDAQDIAQAVFIILARKAVRLRAGTVLTGWLYETTRFTAARWLRTTARRQAREQEAYMQSLNSDSSNVWEVLALHLEAAMSQLPERDRTLLVLRFYENKTGPEAATLLGLREDATHKRTARALEKLRKFFSRRGVALSAAAIAGAVSANSVQAAPAALGKTITAVAVTHGVAAGGSTLTLVKGALKLMAWTKMKTAIVAGAAVVLAAGTTTITVEKVLAKTSSQLTREGWQLLQAGKRPEATTKFSQAVKMDARDPDAWNGLGWAYFNSGRTAEAETTFQKALSLNDSHPAVLNGLGQLYLAQGKYDEAETYLLKAAPSAPAAWFGLARLYLLQEKYDKAEEWARQVVDSGQGDQVAKDMLQAAQEKHLSARLRLLLAPKPGK